MLCTKPLDDPRSDGDGADDPVHVAPAHLQSLEPVVGFVGGHPSRENGDPETPARNLDIELLTQGKRALEDQGCLGITAEVRMDRPVDAELPESFDATRSTRILEELHELVTKSRRREIADEPHLDAASREPCPVLVEPQPVP